MKTKDGWVGGVEIFSSAESGKAETTKAKSINVNELHEQLSHPDDATTRLTGRTLGLNVTGSFQPCEGCLIGKAKRRASARSLNQKTTYPASISLLILALPKHEVVLAKSIGFWLLIRVQIFHGVGSYERKMNNMISSLNS